MSRPVAVLTGDIHFTYATLEPASSVVSQGLALSQKLGVPLVLNGDTLDGKRIIPAEVANRLIELLEPHDPTMIYVNCGNHDLISEKGEESALNFLHPYAQVVSKANSPVYIEKLGSWLVPYFNDSEKLLEFLRSVLAGARLIMHQGVMGAEMGHYIKDSTSLPREAFANFRVISSHYHKRQDIKCGRPRKGAVGLFSYLGSPYTITFAEAFDGPKGINVLYDDGTLELVPTGLRRHVIVETTAQFLDAADGAGADPFEIPGEQDLLWLKVSGSASELATISRKALAPLIGHDHFRLDKIATDVTKLAAPAEKLTDIEILDRLIDQTDESMDQKSTLKALARAVLK